MLVVLAHEAVGEVCVSAITYALSQLPAGRGSTTCVVEIMVGVTTIFAILHTSILFEPFGTNVTVKVWSAILGWALVIAEGAGGGVTVIAVLAVLVQPFAPIAVTL